MPPKKTRPRKREKRFHVELSLSSIFFWGLGFFLFLAWIFVLGILVGRGFLPDGVKTLSKLRRPIDKLQGMVTKRKPSSELDFIKKLDTDPKLSFYKELSSKKEEVAKRTPTHEKKGARQKTRGARFNVVDTGGKYTVQIASLDKQSGAAKMVERLTSCGYPAYFYKIEIKGKTYFRVRCGRFMTIQEASDFNALLAGQEKIRGFVTRVED